MAKFQIDLKTATDDQIKAAFDDAKSREASLREGIDGLTGAEKLARLEEIQAVRAEQEELIGEVSTRQDSAAQAAREAEILASLEKDLNLPEAPAPAAETPAEPAPVEPTAPAEPVMSEAQAGELVAAVASAGTTPAAPQAPAAAATTITERPRPAWTAGVGAVGVNAGHPVDEDHLMDSFNQMIHRASRGEVFPKTIVASLAQFDPKASGLLSRHNTPEVNTALMQEAYDEYAARVTNPAMTASPVCQPFDVIESYPEASFKGTPFTDAIPQRGGADRLGWTFYTPWTMADVVELNDAALTDPMFQVYDPDEQDDIGDGVGQHLKYVVDLGCPTTDEVEFDEIVAGFRVRYQTQVSNPESLNQLMGKIRAYQARRREWYYMGKFDAIAAGYGTEDSPVTTPYGSLPGVADVLLRLYLSSTYDERLNDSQGVVFVPRGLLAGIDLDAMNAAYRSEMLADLQAFLSARVNVRLVEVFENHPSQAGAIRPNGKPFAGALPAAGSSGNTLAAMNCIYRLRVMYPQGILAGSTGKLETGWESSPELLRQNKLQMFSREFVSFARWGEQPQSYLDVALPHNGSRAGFATPFSCSFSS